MKKKLMFAVVLLSAAMLFGCSADKKDGQETTAAVKTESTKAEEKAEEKTEEAKDSAGDAVKANKPYKLAIGVIVVLAVLMDVLVRNGNLFSKRAKHGNEKA